MSHAIFYNRFCDEVSKNKYFQYSISGNLMSFDIKYLYDSINEILESKDSAITEIILDLLNSDEISFKPSRFFSMCCYFNDMIKEYNLRAKIIILMREEQKLMFVTEQRDCFVVKVIEEDKVNGYKYVPTNEIIVNEPPANLSCCEPLTHQIDKIKLNSSRLIVNLHNYRFLVFSLSTCVSFAFLLIGLIFYMNTTVGFLLIYSGILLIYESFIISIKLFRNTNNKWAL